MFKPATQAFFSIPGPQAARALVAGVVDRVDPGQVRITFPGAATLVAGQDVMLLAEVAGKLRQQPARVIGTAAVEPVLGQATVVCFELVGASTSAEQREAYRASAVLLGIPLTIARVKGCLLADVGPEGIGALCPRSLPLGSMVEVALALDGHTVATLMRVQTAKRLPNGTQRFGLFQPVRGSADRRTLEQLTSHLQRLQLKRISAA